MNSFIIKAKLPSLNEYVKACRTNRYKGASFKRDVEEVIGWAIKQALTKGTLKPTQKPCKVLFEWHEKTTRRDCDNIASAKKYILDAMQQQGIIVNDNQKYIKGFTDVFFKDVSDYVVVTLTECDKPALPEQKTRVEQICRDCKHFTTEMPTDVLGWCEKLNTSCFDTDYCSRAERKNNDD